MITSQIRIQKLMEGFAKYIDSLLLLNEARDNIQQLFLDKGSYIILGENDFIQIEESIIIKSITKEPEIDEKGIYVDLTYSDLRDQEIKVIRIYGNYAFYKSASRLIKRFYVL